MKWKYSFLIFLLIISSVVASEYQYLSKIQVNCEEYKGFVSFDLPKTFTMSSNGQMNQDWWISEETSTYNKQTNWYVTEINTIPSNQIEKIHDGNFNTFLIIEGSNTTLNFKNTDYKTVNRIIIDVSDSIINTIKLPVKFTMRRNGFHYELDLNTPISGKEIKIFLQYNDLIKIKEIAFYQKSGERKIKGYFYVNNDCNKTRELYFGKYGNSNYRKGSKLLPVTFETTVKTIENSNYSNDFDEDGILNEQDNCLNKFNPDQKDINYNGKGDVCDDEDRDGIINSEDNCPKKSNRNQYDSDKDGIGDSCDEQDNRFFEQNAIWMYLFAGIIVLIFLAVSFSLLKKQK